MAPEMRSSFPAVLPNCSKIAVVTIASILVAGCAYQQKVDRVHSSLHYQQASIQQLQKDLATIQQQRAEVLSSLEQLQTNSTEHTAQIQQNALELEQLDNEQEQLDNKLSTMNHSVAVNRGAISNIKNSEQERLAIIKSQQEKWLEITAQADKELAEVNQPEPGRHLQSAE